MDLHLDSKTMIGLIGILILATTLSVLGKLSPEMVDIIKYVGGFYFGVRAIANYSEGKSK